MQLVDSHCHINFDDLIGDLDGVMERARAHDVGYMLCVSINMETYPEVRRMAVEQPNVFASVGVHPNEREGAEPGVDELVELAADERVVAIGETGLDYYRSQGDLDWQRDRFATHIRAARTARKPLIIHTRNAAADTLEIMRAEGAGEAGGVMHCFAEDWDVARAALDLGFYISFSGIVTFKNAVTLREVAEKVPGDRMLVETDAPYLAPVPYRGKTNEPAYVRYVAECVAEVRGESLGQVAETTTENFFNLFNSASKS